MRCKGCQRYFTPHPKPNGYDHALREQAIGLYLEGMSFRSVGRQLGINYQSVVNWVDAHHDEVLPEKVEDETPTDTVEVDELYTYVGKKSVKRS
jgi:transposase-like protein